ncbi:MAG: glycosyltransferase [Gemmataceae bacterium]
MTIATQKKIVLLGMMSEMPCAGVIWQTIHYLIGFKRLGFDVYYVEAHARTPSKLMRHPSDDASALAAAFIDRYMRRFGLGDRWAFHALHADGRVYGMSDTQLKDLYSSAELIINLHGGTLPRPEHYAHAPFVFLETDPVAVQIELYHNDQRTIDYLAPHSAFFTFGENYGRPDCKLPVQERFHFRPTRQPVVFDFWQSDRREQDGAFTTIGNWIQYGRDVEFQGDVYTWSKHHEFVKFLDVPRRTSQEFELAMGSVTDVERQMLREHDWRVRPSGDLSDDIDLYRTYIQQSRGEFTVAKDQNIRLRSGWFSDRSTTYLAAGRPVINQDTGFGNSLPTGRGLFAFATMDDILTAVDAINSQPEVHCRAATEIAREYFNYDVVLMRLLADLGVSPTTPGDTSIPTKHALSPDLNLQPVSRWPTTLPSETSQAISNFAWSKPQMTDGDPVASIIIVARDGLLFTRLCLTSLAQNTSDLSFEVIVIDNGSSDGTVDYLRELANRWPAMRLVENGSNRGFAAAVNQGLVLARGTILVLLNNDTVVTPGWLNALTEHLNDPAIGLVGPVTNRSGNEAEIDTHYRTYGDLEAFAAERNRRYAGRVFDIRTSTMFCAALRRDVFDRVGLLDEQFELGLFEDDDYCMRIRQAGYRVVCADNAFVHHIGQGSMGELSHGEYNRLFALNKQRWETKWNCTWQPHGHRRSPAYEQLVEHVQKMVGEHIPSGATVLVISKGDEDLVRFSDRRAEHFPQDEEGRFAGHYPADDVAAIAHLEMLRHLGCTHLLIPARAFWWLDHYEKFREHLEGNFGLVWRDEHCVIYSLLQKASTDSPEAAALAGRTADDSEKLTMTADNAPSSSHDADEREKWERYYSNAPLAAETECISRFNTEFVDAVLELLPSGGATLEAGCGAGWQSLALARTGVFRVNVMDFSPAALDLTRRMFAREGLSATYHEDDIFHTGSPDFDLVFNAGVLEHYTFDEQVSILRAMGSRSRRFVLILVPNRLCYWYWLWRLQTSAAGQWPFGTETPVVDLSAVFEAAGIQFLGETFVGRSWSEDFINNIAGLDPVLRRTILQAHRTMLIPEAQKSYLIAALGCVAAPTSCVPARWTRPLLYENVEQAQLISAMADAMSQRLADQVKLEELNTQAEVYLQQNRLDAAQLEEMRRQFAEQADLAHEARCELQRQAIVVRELQSRLAEQPSAPASPNEGNEERLRKKDEFIQGLQTRLDGEAAKTVEHEAVIAQLKAGIDEERARALAAHASCGELHVRLEQSDAQQQELQAQVDILTEQLGRTRKIAHKLHSRLIHQNESADRNKHAYAQALAALEESQKLRQMQQSRLDELNRSRQELLAQLTERIALTKSLESELSARDLIIRDLQTPPNSAVSADFAAEAGRQAEEARRHKEQLERSEAKVLEFQNEINRAKAELVTTQQSLEKFRTALAEETRGRQLLEALFTNSYDQLRGQLHSIVATHIPSKATVVVVSKGDETLLDLNGRRAWHFPQTASGMYAGHYPADSQDAIRQLEAIRDKGGEYLLLPNTSFWWLDYYTEFREFLITHCKTMHRDERCMIFDLLPNERRGVSAAIREWLRPIQRVWSSWSNGEVHRNGTSAPLTNGTGKPDGEVATVTNDIRPASYDVICLPVIEWDFRFQRPQQLMSEFAQAGHRVFYVSPIFAQSSEPYRVRSIQSNLLELTLRGPKRSIQQHALDDIARKDLFAALSQLRRDYDIDQAVAIVQLPFWWPLAREARSEFSWPVVYDLMDAHAGFTTNGAPMLDQERELLEQADLVTASSETLEKLAWQRNQNVLLLRNGCDYDHFASAARPEASARPVIGYYGAISNWFDVQLVEDLARRRKDWDFILVGAQHGVDTAGLEKLPNVKMPGEQPYAEIPDWLERFHVSIIPFKRTLLTEATNPVKAYEILASGTPLVSTPLPEVAEMAPLVRLASTSREFEREIEAALVERDASAIGRRREFARNNTWRERFEALRPAIRRLFCQVQTTAESVTATDVSGLVTVVLPVYNQANLLKESIQSVLSQTYQNFELIVVNDGSTDGVEAVLDQYARHPKVRLLTQKNQKLPKALSNAFEFARGEFWTWTSADNLMHPEQLARQVEFLRAHPEAGMVYADYLAIDDRGQPLRDVNFRPHNRRTPDCPEIHVPRTTESLNHVQDNFIGACFMYRGWIGKLIGEYDPNLGVEDYDYWMRLNSLFKIMHIGTDEVLYQYRVHDNSLNGRAAELKILDRVQALMQYEHDRYAFYRGPWTVFADEATLEWLRTINAGGHSIRAWREGDPALLAPGKKLLMLRDDGLARLPNVPGDIDELSVAVWFPEGSLSPYRHGDATWRRVHTCFVQDGTTQARLAHSGVLTLSTAPSQSLFDLALAHGNNNLFYGKTRPATMRQRELPAVYLPKGRRLRVLLQVNSFSQGGLEQVVLDLAASLDRNRFEVSLLILGEEGWAANCARRAGVTVLSLPSGDRQHHYRRLLLDNHIDVINAHYSLFGGEIAAELGIPFVQTIHNTYAWLSARQILDHQVYDQYTAAYICVSQNVAFYSDARLSLPPRKLLVVPNGIETKRFDRPMEKRQVARLRNELGLRDDDFVFLNVASVYPPKAQRFLVEALARIHGRRPEAKVLFLGRDLEKSYVEDIQRDIRAHGLQDAIIFAGHRDDVVPFYQLSNAFVLPSFWEGWSLALAEAAYAGLPLIATDVGSARDVIAEVGGYLIRPPFDSITDLDATNLSRVLEAEHPQLVEDLATAMGEVCAEPVKPKLTQSYRQILTREQAYASYAHIFEWIARGGSIDAVRAWTRRGGIAEFAVPAIGHSTHDSRKPQDSPRGRRQLILGR